VGIEGLNASAAERGRDPPAPPVETEEKSMSPANRKEEDVLALINLRWERTNETGVFKG